MAAGKMKLKKNIQSEKIESAIADFEKSVDFEFIPVIADRSSYVEHISWVLSLIFLLLIVAGLDMAFAGPWHDTWMSPLPFYIAAPFISFALGVALDKSDLVDRFFISRAERQRQVQEKAERFFFKMQLDEIKTKNALLLYVSVMERQIVLFPDPRLNFSKMPEINQQLLKILQKSFKGGDYEAGILLALGHLKESLGADFAKHSKSENIVPNKLIWWND